MTATIIEIFLTLLALSVVIGLFAFVILHSIGVSDKGLQQRDVTIKRLLGDDIQIIRGFPIDQNLEEIVQGGFRSTIQKYRELVVGKGWLFLQASGRGVPVLTATEDRSLSTLGLYAYGLDHFTPTIVIRNNHNQSFLARFVQQDLQDKTLIWCEAAFDKDHNVYNLPGLQLDTLSILSPEVLEVLRNAPGSADILLKRNQLYYMLPGGLSAEDILPGLITHSAKVSVELNENLRRWAAGPANQDKLNNIKSSELSVTLREQTERSR